MSFVRRNVASALAAVLFATTMLTSCASTLPNNGAKAEAVPAERANKKYAAINRDRSPITYVKLEGDVLRPKMQSESDPLPKDVVGPFELREESLAAALELVLADKKIPMAFQTNQAMTRTVTITSLQGPLDQVVDKLCSLADLYCSYEGGVLVIKDTQTFTVSLPPFIAESYDPFVKGLEAITGGQTYVDNLTGSLIYTASHRNNEKAKEYFDRLRVNTAMIVYEIQIWEVELTDAHQTGIDWDDFTFTDGDFIANLVRDGSPSIAGAVGIGAQITSDHLTANGVLNFLQTQGAVKTISQPQLTVLSGSKAKLRVGNKRDYVSQITRTVGVSSNDNVSVTTSKLETGLELEIGSAWSDGTVYGNLKILLQNLIRLGSLDVGTTSIQLPETSDRNLETKLRVRPGDAVLIGGIVEERGTVDEAGPPGFKNKPLFTTSKNNTARNSELVFMLRPRVVIYTENPPENAQLMQGGIVAEPPRVQNTPRILPEQAPQPIAVPSASGAAGESMSNYLDQLPADQIAPAQ